METFVSVYLLLGVLITLGLVAWLAATEIRRHGLRAAVARGARAYVRALPLNWRVPYLAWLGIAGYPVIVAAALIEGDFEWVGAVFLFLMWLGAIALWRWHVRAKRRLG